MSIYPDKPVPRPAKDRFTDPRPASVKELRLVRQELQVVQMNLSQLNAKIKLANKQANKRANERAIREMQSIRARLLARLDMLTADRTRIVNELDAKPLTRVDLVEVVTSLTEVENAIVNQGAQGGHEAIRAFIQFCLNEIERTENLGA